MKIKTAEFVISNTNPELCPTPDKPEYAFIGRSNVGKSSLINTLTERKSLAKTSTTPGKTQLINHFIINDEWYLVDLPGYGYAKSSKKQREKWDGFIRNYLNNRTNLIYTFVLLDSRLEPQKIDLEFMEMLGLKGIPFVMVFTKLDKLSSSAANKNLSHYKKVMLKAWEELPPIILTSSTTKLGRDEVLKTIEETNKDFVFKA
ncbi:MAG: YihA family ribosome biogenesis GTP-binding protein [Bacteroidetes bacterium]|nr:MAG: YihA family ribosome biogenesis GTP-binding protein [Bacteroidota bacterium]MBL1145743.1 YihA family ribosome biogenesis GTP-binding protein [Bacteroidota bacterium]MCB0803236.1 YihA family ribosome biogenesis GTP-binding protein [Flavobacteriales bacterium]NOG58537.1 YihA family ribosome biogenesis GTP-binding protein [Bacteroidota bacterium]